MVCEGMILKKKLQILEKKFHIFLFTFNFFKVITAL